jgi:hypothetical protein
LGEAVQKEPVSINEDVDFEKSPANSEASGLLSIPPRIYREFADEYKKLAQTTSDTYQRELYLKMASTWTHAAIRFESGVETIGLTAEHNPTADDQEAHTGER